jgi:thiosulfate/3-mercaptopyruvate sulfurtransferase
LIEAVELARPEVGKKFRVLDARPTKDWEKGHIPSALAVDVAGWSKKFTKDQDAATWGKELGALGLGVDQPVLVYGDDIKEVSRVWWILHYWGFKDARILNGGWTAWTASNFPVEKGKQAAVAPTTPKLIPAEKRLATMEMVKDSLNDHLLQIIDARSEGEYCGDTKTAKRNGAIPGAVNLEWKDLLDGKTKKFKTAAELELLFNNAGIDLAKPSVAHCQSGGRSSVMVFTMELMGGADVRNYYRSWAEWGNADDTPVVIPKKK